MACWPPYYSKSLLLITVDFLENFIDSIKFSGSHDIYSMRDMRDALGALGPVDGQNPELNNLTCSMTICEAGDVVFLTSDGVSDNFDPVVGKFALPKKDEKPPSKANNGQQNPTTPDTPNTQNTNKTSGSKISSSANNVSSGGSTKDLRNGGIKELRNRQQGLSQKQQRRQQALSNSARGQMPSNRQPQSRPRGGFRQVGYHLFYIYYQNST